MATYIDTAKKMVTCPYDPAHRMLNSRLQAHITKCRLNHLDTKLVACPFNAQHLEKEGDIEYHITHCPDRIQLDRQLAVGVYENEFTRGRTAVPSYIESPSLVQCSENWDNEIDVNPSAGYVPKGPIESNGIIMDLGMTKPAERKKIYRQAALAASAEPVNKPAPKPEAPKPMRQPKLSAETLHTMMKNATPPPTKGKIAANIFGENETAPRQPTASYKALLSQVNSLNLGIGRGRGAPRKNYDSDYPPL